MNNQKGFGPVVVIIVVAVFLGVSVTAFFIANKGDKDDAYSLNTGEQESDAVTVEEDSSEETAVEGAGKVPTFKPPVEKEVVDYTDSKVPPFEAGAGATLQFAVVYTIDRIPYAQGQFQTMEGHDGCPFYHSHSSATVYPFEEWYVRGGTDEVQLNGSVALRDPEPYECGFGRDVTLGPKSVLVPPAHFLYVCDFFEFGNIESSTEYDRKRTEWLYNFCKHLSGA